MAIGVVWLGAPSGLGAAESGGDPQQQIAALRAEIARHDEAYHRRAAPTIGDSDYDQLKRKLATLEREHPAAAKAVPPLREIGDDRSGLFATVRHRERMLSLEKAYTAADLRAFHARLVQLLGRGDLAFVVEPKFDGLAVSVTYERGKLVRAVTRGNGTEGDDVTAHVRAIAGVPGEVRAGDGSRPALIEVRGELYVPFAEFARVNAEREAAGEAVFANPRALAAGALRQLDPTEVGRRGVRAVFFGVGACEPPAALPATQRELRAWLTACGLPAIADAQSWPARGVEALIRTVEACRVAREQFVFPTDGAVVKLDAFALQREAGAAENSPRWAVAYKFAAERAETQVLAITVQVGRTGVLTPVAELAPVRLAGSTIARATLHNRAELARKDIRIGDTVYLEKAGDVIPALVGVNLSRRPAGAVPFVFPAACPDCRGPVSERADEAAVRCGNADCPAQLRRRLEHFASRGCVDIAGLGPATIELLVGKRVLRDLPDLYRLRREDLAGLGQNAGKSGDQLLAAIAASKSAELWRFIAGLGIPQVGAVTARELARRHGSLEALVAAATSAGSGGDGAEGALRVFFAEPKNRAMVAGLSDAGVRPGVGSRVADAGKPAVVGKVFVLTGTLPTLTRAQAAAQIEAAGGKIVANVSRATHYLVAGSEAGAKLTQAKALGVPVIDEAGLQRMLAEPIP